MYSNFEGFLNFHKATGEDTQSFLIESLRNLLSIPGGVFEELVESAFCHKVQLTRLVEKEKQQSIMYVMTNAKFNVFFILVIYSYNYVGQQQQFDWLTLLLLW